MGNPEATELTSNVVVRFNCTLQGGSVSNVEVEALFFKKFSSLGSFLNTCCCEINVYPARKSVFEVPC